MARVLGDTWALDHVVDATDVMSYNFDGSVQPAFHDHEACGGDCVGGTSPSGLPCSGNGATATHACIGGSGATQDEVATLVALFGASSTASDGGTGGGAGGGPQAAGGCDVAPSGGQAAWMLALAALLAVGGKARRGRRASPRVAGSGREPMY